MRLLRLVVSCLFFLGCQKNGAKEFEGLADRACDCAEQDTACGNKVLTDLAKFSETNKTSGEKAWVKAGVRLHDCLTATGVKMSELTAALDRIGD